LKSEIRDLKGELAEAKRELKAVSPDAARFLRERRTKRKHINPDLWLDLPPNPARET